MISVQNANTQVSQSKNLNSESRTVSVILCSTYNCCLPEFRCLQKSSDNLCGELAKNQTRELSQTLMKHED